MMYIITAIKSIISIIAIICLSHSQYRHIHHSCRIVPCVHGLAVRSTSKESVDSCSRPKDSSNSLYKNKKTKIEAFCILRFILIKCIIFQVNALLGTLELQDSAKRQGHFALFNCLVLGHTKYNCVQQVYCNPFPANRFMAVIAWTLS